MERQNLTVRTGAQVERVVVEPDKSTGGRRATGVALVGTRDILQARREVILAAGSIGSRRFCSSPAWDPVPCCGNTGSMSFTTFPG